MKKLVAEPQEPHIADPAEAKYESRRHSSRHNAAEWTDLRLKQLQKQKTEKDVTLDIGQSS